MSNHKNFGNKSQDARRHEQQHEIHPTDKTYPPNDKSTAKSETNDHTKRHKRK